MLRTLTLLAAAGAIGTLGRFGIGSALARFGGGGFPWATFLVNAIGCFLFGLVAALAEERGILSAESKLIVLTGFLGAFTTFSTFAFDTASFVRGGDWALAAINFAAQNVVGVVLVLAGGALGRPRP